MKKFSRTTPYKNYIAPGKHLVKQTANDLQFDKNYSYNLVKDIANYLSYPEETRDESLTKPSSWEFELTTNYILPVSRKNVRREEE